jgi:hypothetical protein
MKTFLAIIGAFIMVTFILGMLGLVDFVLCVRAPGECHEIQDVKYESI